MDFYNLLIFLFFYNIVFLCYGKGNSDKDDKNIVLDIDDSKPSDGGKNIVDNLEEDNSDSSTTMYKKLFNNIVLSDEEKKLVGAEENDTDYDKSNSCYTDFHNIKYGVLNWTKLKNRDIVNIDLYSKQQMFFHVIQDLGMDGSCSFSLIPEIIYDIGTLSGYNGYNIYKTKDEELTFVDTKKPLGDLKASFDFDSGDGFIAYIKTYFSVNSNAHFGISTNLLLRRRVLSQKSSDKFNLAIINFPISSYFLYKSKDQKFLGLVNISFDNYIHSDHGGTNVDGNPKFITERDTQDILDNVLYKRLTGINLLCYFQYKFSKICFYGQYNLNYESNSLSISAEKQTKKIEVDGRNKEIIDYKDKITAGTINYLFIRPETGIYYFIKNCDEYLQNNFEIGVKDNLKFGRNYYFSYNVYYSFRFSTRVIKGGSNITSIIENVVSNNVLKREWYFDPLTLGGNFNIFNITFSPKLTVSEKSVLYRLFLGYNMKYFSIKLNLARYKIPLIYRKYKCFYNNMRFYEKRYDKLPIDLYIDLEGNIPIKDILQIKPRVLFNVSWNKVYFKKAAIDGNNNISTPSQNKNALLHLVSGITFNVKFLKYFHVELTPIFNKKLYFSKNIDYETNENADNVPLFSLSSRFYFQKEVSKNVAEVIAGVEVFWRTNYNPNSFDMLIQQHFSQSSEDKFSVFFKPKVNLYCNVRFGNFIGSFKLNILNIFWDGATFASKNYPNNNDYYMFTIQYLMY